MGIHCSIQVGKLAMFQGEIRHITAVCLVLTCADLYVNPDHYPSQSPLIVN